MVIGIPGNAFPDMVKSFDIHMDVQRVSDIDGNE